MANDTISSIGSSMISSANNTLDIKQLVTSLVNAERKPLQELEAKKSVSNAKISNYGNLENLRDTADAANKKLIEKLYSSTSEEVAGLVATQVQTLNKYYEQLKTQTSKDGKLQGDISANLLKSSARNNMSAAIYNDQNINFLKINRETGSVEFDKDKLTSQLSTEPERTKSILQNISNTLSNALSNTTGSSSTLETRIQSLQEQNKQIDKRIERYNDYLDNRQKLLMSQFTSMQSALASITKMTIG